MRYTKKLFKHGGSLAMVIPAEFAELLNTDEVTLEVIYDKNSVPSMIVQAKNELDSIEEDPAFAAFIQALYKHAMENPGMLSDGSDIWNDRVRELIEGVDLSDEE